MALVKGTVGSPSPAQPTLPPSRRRTRMKSLLAQQAAAKAFAKVTQSPVAPAKRQYTKRAARWDPKISPAINLKSPKVTVMLQLRHSLNGVFYGPGRVTLPTEVADLFLNTEANAAEKELTLNQQQAFIIGMGPGGPVKRQVPWAKFDQLLTQEG